MFDINRYGKWFYIAWGLLLLVGLTGWFSGGKNGNLIFTTSITAIFVIMFVAFFLLKLPELRYGRERIWQMREEEREREFQLIKEESDIWGSLSKEERLELCKGLHISSKYSKVNLIDVPINERGRLTFFLGSFYEKGQNTENENHSQEKASSAGIDVEPYYDFLGLDKNATEDDVKRAYKERTLALHPDKMKNGDLANKLTKYLLKAKDEVLEDIKRRTGN